MNSYALSLLLLCSSAVSFGMQKHISERVELPTRTTSQDTLHTSELAGALTILSVNISTLSNRITELTQVIKKMGGPKENANPGDALRLSPLASRTTYERSPRVQRLSSNSSLEGTK